MKSDTDMLQSTAMGVIDKRPIFTDVLRWFIYPMTMAACIAVFFLLRASGMTVFWATYTPVLLGAATVTFFEMFLPARSEWSADRHSVGNDLLFMVIVQIFLPKVLTFLLVISLQRWLSGMGWTAGLWVHDWPLGLQAILMILLADFFRYWLHVACHRYPLFWRLHAVHHSPSKLYWLNVGRFHPLEKSFQFVLDATPFILLGVGEWTLGLYLVFYSVNGFFQHCNIDLRFGWLNYVVSSAELHRWHHSRVAAEANNNYGNNIIIWDLLFGTWFLPTKRLVAELGLMNDDYPLDFNSQIKTPFIPAIDQTPVPVDSWRGLLLNQFLRLRMTWIGWNDYRPICNAAKNPHEMQRVVLKRILSSHEGTRFAREHGISGRISVSEFQERVPIQDYESLRPYIEKQEQTGESWLNPTQPVMYNVTSGTTGLPKYLPVLQETLNGIRKTQRVATYVQYQTNPVGFQGKIFGIVGPAVEGHMDSGTPYGSASGRLYKGAPRVAQAKYALPPEVFEVEDYEAKYYAILRFALTHRDITYVTTANPSTLLKLLDVLGRNRQRLLDDIHHGTVSAEIRFSLETRRVLERFCRPNPDRARELRELFERDPEPAFHRLWPYLQIVATWTGGSCGIAIETLKRKLPEKITLIGLGLLASELVATVTINAKTNEGLPTFWENFFEFVEVDKYESGKSEFLTLDQVQQGKNYYLFVTTPAGLFRYSMHDIVRVVGRFHSTPTLEFLQKGTGVTNVTGEKLYENQVLAAMKTAEKHLAFRSRFFQLLADESTSRYLLYLEADAVPVPAVDAIANELDTQLSKVNMEYSAKRASGRLGLPEVYLLEPGTFDQYKQHLIAQGRRESQLKVSALQYVRDIDFDFAGCFLRSKNVKHRDDAH